ncbi:piwi-like protein Siwi [Ischnura elegans]|uniref:piwi-like protein Siwi n=1 Tax=Ischnura elegans TaxID=197161 RepID=UPI001ED87263|nr:piwi-like protein Siwi [Ischnura elegans]XP_046398367.1 piwi-like protein Siwi [Ischnura elegans]
MADAGRGRSRGRSRGRAAESQRPQGQPVRQPGPLPAAPPPAVSAWGPRPQAPAPPPQQQPSQVAAAGRASQRGGQAPRGDQGMAEAAAKMQAMSIGGAGDAPAGGRGAMRGGRPLPQTVLRTRPKDKEGSKKGTHGTPVNLTANYFQILSKTDWCLYQYRVDFSPEEDRTGVRKSLLRVHKKQLGGYIFDGTMMFASHKFPDKVMELYSTRNSDEAQIRITIKLVGDLAVGDYHYIQFFNILVRKCFGHMDLQLVGRNFFDAKARIAIPEYRLELWPGYLTSIRQHENNLLMCAEISHKVMRKDSVLHLMSEFTNMRGNFQDMCNQKILGCIVMTEYNNKTYRVDEVAFNETPMSTFSKGGENITYMKYYQERYGIKIHDPKQPLLLTRTKARDRRAGAPEHIYLIPELCRLTGLTEEMRNNNKLMAALSQYTRVDPRGRIGKLKAFKDRMLATENIVQDFKDWNLNLSQNLVNLPGRQLPPENVYGNSRQPLENTLANWTKGMRSCRMVSLGVMNDWVIIFPRQMERDVGKWVESIQRAGGGMGMSVHDPEYIQMNDDRPNSYMQTLDQILSQRVPDLIMCLVTTTRADRYNAIKKRCCIDRAVPTQVVSERVLRNPKGLMSIATKVAIQINCKTGGAPWRVDMPLSGLMVVGFDVCHDTTNRSKSYGALVASLDDGLTRYFSAVSEHTTGEELSNDIGANLVKALRKYSEVNKKLPSKIVIYRDGVGEGQVNYVVEHEVETIKESLKKVYGGDNYRMAFVIVTKRINTRFFLGDRNPGPGTVVDDVVTLPERYDFFLISQSVMQGTVTPTSYNVVWDNVELAPDRLQRLTYKMTHLYFNWSGTVRVPAPCQYAHKLAFLVGQSLHRAPRVELADRLYFL